MSPKDILDQRDKRMDAVRARKGTYLARHAIARTDAAEAFTEDDILQTEGLEWFHGDSTENSRTQHAFNEGWGFAVRAAVPGKWRPGPHLLPRQHH